MPPKRAASSASKAAPAAKKSRSSAGGTDTADEWESASSSSGVGEDGAPKVKPKNSKRWAAVSASRNIEEGYYMQLADPAEASTFVCLCEAPWDGDSDDEEDDSGDEEEGDGEEDEDVNARKKKAADKTKDKPAAKIPCDGGKKCRCGKPAAEHPDHPWVLTMAGRAKFNSQGDHCDVRDPANFEMYTFNDHFAYGVLEVIQNLILDYEEAKGGSDWKPMWAVVEGLTFFLKTNTGLTYALMDDGEGASAVTLLLARLFMNALAYLEREGLLKRDSEVKNLGLIMALWMSLAGDFDGSGLLEGCKKESLGPAKDKKKWQPHLYADQVVAYAKKYEIKLVGPSDLDEILEQLGDDADLPNPESNTEQADVFGYAKAYKKYKSKYGRVPSMMAGFPRKRAGNQPMGGDSLDITSWTPAERKKSAFNGKDPLGKRELDAIKKGMVMSMG